jgi:menaquinone-dependent protoporphyrinogen IX oxidase
MKEHRMTPYKVLISIMMDSKDTEVDEMSHNEFTNWAPVAHA